MAYDARRISRATGVVIGGAGGMLTGGIIMAVTKGGKGMEGYAAELTVILECVALSGLIGALLGLVFGVLKNRDKPMP